VTLAHLLAERPAVLLDFDGPVCSVFGGDLPTPEVARRLAESVRASGVRLPDAVEATGDPFDVLHAAARNSPDDAEHVERALRDAEVLAVSTAPVTPGLRHALAALLDSGHTVTIVINNSAAAVHAFVAAHDLGRFLRNVVARTEPDPTLLKPNPYLVERAIFASGPAPARSVLVGDSTTDVTAAHCAGAAAVAYANKPGKRAALAALAPAAPRPGLCRMPGAMRRRGVRPPAGPPPRARQERRTRPRHREEQCAARKLVRSGIASAGSGGHGCGSAHTTDEFRLAAKSACWERPPSAPAGGPR
jgi:phosphoglycolate phosphatase